MSRVLLVLLVSMGAVPAAAQTLFAPTPDSALRGFSTDRPTKSFTPITVDAGHVQYETDFYNFTHSNVGGVTTRLTTFADPVLKIGLTDRVDLAVQFNGYNLESVGEQRSRGAGDIVVRPKINLFGNAGGPALAVLPYVKFPTAAGGIGNGQTEGGVITTFTAPAPWGFTVLLMPEVDVLRNANDTGHHFSFTQLINVSHPVGPRLTVFGELFSALGTDARTRPVYTFDVAAEFAVTPTLQLDAGLNVGLNRAAPNLQVYTGIGQRF